MIRSSIRKAFVYKLTEDFDSIESKDLVENREFVPPISSPWIRLTIRFGDVFDGELGGGIDIEGGIAFIDVFVPKNSGDNEGLDYSETLRSLFKDEDLTYDGMVVPCQKVDIETIGGEDDYYHQQVRVHFYNFVQK
jgi:hypothetical protein